jgi:hypothetical protein
MKNAKVTKAFIKIIKKKCLSGMPTEKKKKKKKKKNSS